MADILNRLLLETKDFDAKLSNSKKGVNDYQGGITNMAKTAGVGIGKLAGALGLAMGAGEAFNRTLNSSQTLGDMTARNMAALKTSVDSFFYSLGSGEFSPFLNGLGDVINKAKEAHGAIDQLGNTKISHGYFSAENESKIADSQYVAKNKFAPLEDRVNAFEGWRTALNSQREINTTLQADLVKAIVTSVEAEIGGDKLKVTMDDVRMALKIDVTNPQKRDELKSKYSADYEEYRKSTSKLDASYQHFDKNGNVTDDRKGAYRAITKVEKENELSKLNEKYREAIVVNAMLNKYKDEELISIAGQAIEYRKLDSSLASISREYNETANEFNSANKAVKGFTAATSLEGYKVYSGQTLTGSGGSPKPTPPPAGSIAAINEEIAAKNKELINATTMQARIAVQTTINELEAKKINLQIATDKGIFAAEHGEDKFNVSNVRKDFSQYTDIDKQVSVKRKELISTTTEEARSAVQSTIDELEAKKIELSANIDIKSNMSSEIAGVLNNGSKDKDGKQITKGSKAFDPKSVKKIKSPISKKDVKTLDDYQEKLYNISNAMGSMAGVMGEGAASWLNWGSSLISAINQGIPAIKNLILALQGKACGEAIAGAAASGPWGWIEAGLAVASIVASFASIPAFANGGIIEGGSTFGDMNLARVNAGEMILNGNQQRNLFDLLNNGSNSSASKGGAVSFTIHGKDLKGVLSNYDNQKNKVR